MPIPPALNLVTVIGQSYGTDTTARTGRIIFDLEQMLTDSTDKVVLPPYNAIAVLGYTNMIVVAGLPVGGTTPVLAGQFSIVLLATDNANLTPQTANSVWYYRTTYDLDGSAPYTIGYLVPHTPSPVDISALTQTPIN